MRLTQSMKNKVMSHAEGSLYRMNAKTADCYAFRLVRTEKGKLDFYGGWDWTYHLVDQEATWLYLLGSRTFKLTQPKGE